MKTFRGEILSVPEDPVVAGAEAIRHFEDGLLVVEDGLVLACGPQPRSSPASRRPPRKTRRLIVPSSSTPCPLSQNECIASTAAADAMARAHILRLKSFRRPAHPMRGRLLPRRMLATAHQRAVFATVHAYRRRLFESALTRECGIVPRQGADGLGPYLRAPSRPAAPTPRP